MGLCEEELGMMNVNVGDICNVVFCGYGFVGKIFFVDLLF